MLQLSQIEKIVSQVEYPSAHFSVIKDNAHLTFKGRFNNFLNLDSWDRDRTLERCGATEINLDVVAPHAQFETEQSVLLMLRQIYLITVIHEADEFFYYNGRRIFDPHQDETRQEKTVTLTVRDF